MSWLRDATDRLLGRRPDPPAGPRLELPRVPTTEDLLHDLDEFEARVDPQVPPMVAARVDRVTTVIRETIPRLAQLGAGSAQAHTVIATATSYLPEAVGAYLRLPRSFADHRPVDGGRTSLMVLCDQLDLLAAEMDQVFDAVCRADADALVVHGAFLAEKFGRGGDLGLGPAPELGLPPHPGLPQPDRDAAPGEGTR